MAPVGRIFAALLGTYADQHMPLAAYRGIRPDMIKPSHSRFASAAAIAAMAVALAACQSNTYGTGRSPGLQTVEDIVGIAALSNEKREPIDYKPRPGIVAPPSTATLPAPGASGSTMVASNWPVDPDVQRAQLKADAAAREAAGLPTPKFSLPRSESTEPIRMRDPEAEAMSTPEQREAAKKMFADARGAVAVDENGMPVRRYLTDPPSEYRMPDPTAPVEIVDKPKPRKKFKWWWQN